MGELVSPLRYDNQHDVEMRLHNTIVRYKEQPVLCRIRAPETEPFNGLGVQIRPIAAKQWGEIIHSSDSDLDISSLPLGYLNVGDFTAYITRIPYRKQKQGISSDNTSWWPETFTSVHISFWSAIMSKNFCNTVFNIYPNAEQALKALSKKASSVYSIAIHRKFALVKDELGIIKIKHMTKPIGWIPPGEKKGFLTEENYNPIFEEDLKELGLECRAG